MKTHAHAEGTYRIVPLQDGLFGVEVVIPETFPTIVSAIATGAEAEVWIANHKSQVEAGTSRPPIGWKGNGVRS